MNNNPQTYNDDRINEKSRAVFFKALEKLDDALSGKAELTAERMHALAAVADAAACGFEAEDGEDDI